MSKEQIEHVKKILEDKETHSGMEIYSYELVRKTGINLERIEEIMHEIAYEQGSDFYYIPPNKYGFFQVI